MSVQQEPLEPSNRRRGIYLLPNLFTTAGLFSGFYAIVAAMKGLFDVAPLAVFIAMVMDGLDGRVARLTNTQSAFGAEYDSLSDMVAFGLAPALVVYHWGLLTIGKIGWLIAFFYTATTALRLARFNVMFEELDKRFFPGLPCPAAAAVVVGMVWLFDQYGVSGKSLSVWVALLTALMGLLMASDIRYYSFKTLEFKGTVPFVAITGVVMLFVGLWMAPQHLLFFTFLIYALSGPVWAVWRRIKKRSRKKKSK